jgi:PKD repeat protein
MGRLWQLACTSAVIVCTVFSGLVLTGPPASAGVAQPTPVATTPTARTPHVLDNRVLDFAEVGSRIVAVGDFTQAQDSAANGGAAWTVPYVVAFDATTGAIDRAFAPAVNGVVNAVLPGPGNTVYLGGTFSTVNGATARNLVQVSLATGARVVTFAPTTINGAVFDLVMSGGRMFVGGTFSTFGGAAHGGLAAVNPTTGAVDEYLGVDVSVNHNWNGGTGSRGAVGVRDLAVSPDGSRLVAIGNFKLADGIMRDQVVSVLLQPAGAVVDPNWRTRRYEPACFSNAYDFYVREVDFSPDGRYFVVVTTGGHNVGTLCDTAARWEVTDTGDAVQPRWIADTGGDTLHSVAVTGAAVYVGGHQRWLNNALGNDSAGAGGVPRPGIAALDTRTGIPLAWNPGRNPRGIGAEALMATAAGLYVGSDTEYIGDRDLRRERIAYFPLTGAAPAPSEDTGTLPANVYVGGPRAATPVSAATVAAAGQVLYRVNAGGPAIAASDGGPAWAADDGSLRNGGSSTAGYAPSAASDGSVPETTPAAVFDTERWDPAGNPEMQWRFPVAAGTTVEVRVYVADRCTCTSAAGDRVFDVSIDGAVVLDDYDVVADVGHQTGTMKSFVMTSDGTVDVAFGHVAGDPMVNAIEIVEHTGTQAAVAAGVDDVLARWFDGSTAAPDRAVGNGGLEWSRVRGAFVAGGTLYYGYPAADGRYGLFQRTFDGTSFGEPAAVDPYNDPFWSTVETGSRTRRTDQPILYRGGRPAFYDQLASVTGMVFRDGRLYYTRSGLDGLFSRGFSLDSGVVGVDEFRVAEAGFGDVAGAFVSGGRFYWASASTGELRSATWDGGALTGSAVTHDGPLTGGRNWSAQALFVGPGEPPALPNQTPTAEFAFDCLGLTCQFDGSASTDPDGSVAASAWDFGDGDDASGATVGHTFDEPGEHQVTLTVTDDDGATSRSTQTVTVEPPPAGTGIALRGSTGTTARPVRAISVDVPGAVQAGDGLVMVLSTNSAVTGTAPAGWTLAGTQTDGGKMTTQVFSRVAGPTDAGSSVTVGVGDVSSALSLQILAYSGTAASGPIASVTGAAGGSGTSHTTPTAQAAAGSTVLSIWSDKGPSARQFTAPASVVERSNLAGAGTGDVATLVADSGGPVPAGRVGGLTATVSASSGRSTMLTVVLAPGSGPAPGNQLPTALISSSCAALDCAFDGSGSTDPDGSVVSYAWDFGDGQSSTEQAPEHSYAAAGEYAVALTVTDDRGATHRATSTVTVAAAPVVGAIGLRGSAGTAARPVREISVDVPEAVQAGDGLVLVLSTNSSVTGTTPAGWTLAATQTDGGKMTTQVFSRVATAADAGSTVTVGVGTVSSALTLQLMAYSGTASTGPVASVTGAAGGGGTAHTTPTAQAVAGSWVLSIWSDKAPTPRQFTPPAALAERSNLAGVGNGDVATLVADSGAAVAGGQVGGLTATVPTASSRSTVLTVVLAPAG